MTSEFCNWLAELYDLGRATGAFGAFARPLNGRVGDNPNDVAPRRDLRRGLVVAVLDGNQSPLTPADETDPNAGHSATTSENALVVANGINYEGGYTARHLRGSLSKKSA